jgi:hypothetical protein
MAALAGLNTDYCVAARVYLQNVPAEVKKSGIDQFRNVMAFAAAAQHRGGGEDPLGGLSQQSMEQQVKAIERLLNEADQITLGWKIDLKAKKTHFDMTFTAVPGSLLDKDLQQMADAKTNFAGFLSPDAVKGQECLYVEGANNNEMYAHAPPGTLRGRFGTVKISPTSAIAMKGQRYPITELGIANLTKRLIEVGEHDLKFDECYVWRDRQVGLRRRCKGIV